MRNRASLTSTRSQIIRLTEKIDLSVELYTNVSLVNYEVWNQLSGRPEFPDEITNVTS